MADEQAVRLAELRSAIDRLAQLYYTPGCKSPVSDAEYDNLIDELRRLDDTDERLTRVGLPYSADELRTKKPHAMPMGSLDNTVDSINGFAPWYDSVLALLGVDPVIGAELNVSFKMDGASVELVYENGKFVQAISRGDGEVGEDLTANAARWMGVPTTLHAAFTGSVRGECMLYQEQFEELKKENPGDSFSNPRNVGNGAMGRTDGKDNEKLRFVAFNFVSEKLQPPTLSMKFKVLKTLGFDVVRYKTTPSNRDRAVEIVEGWFKELADGGREKLGFEIDGLVVMINSVEYQKLLTRDSKDELRPRFGRAVKFTTMKATTKVVGVTITVGHTGVIKPTADLEPVFVGGVTISSAQLNNWNADSESPSAAHVAIGDVVEVERAGDVVPKITRVIIKPEGREPILEPTVCPMCGAATTRTLRDKVGVVTYCSNPGGCAGTAQRKIKHYIGSSDKGVGIMGVGPGVLAALTGYRGPSNPPLVSEPADLYKLTVESLQNLVIGESSSGTPICLGQSRAAALIAEIAKAKVVPLHRFLGALGIELLGRRRVEIIAKEQGLTTLDDWLMLEKLETIPGTTTRQAIVEGIQKSLPIIMNLLAAGVKVLPFGQNVITFSKEDPALESAESKTDFSKGAFVPAKNSKVDLTGTSWCWTGTRECIDEVAAAGGEIKSGISKGLTYLVQKDATSQSNKTIKAESYGVKIVSIDVLKAILAGERPLPK